MASPERTHRSTTCVASSHRNRLRRRSDRLLDPPAVPPAAALAVSRCPSQLDSARLAFGGALASGERRAAATAADGSFRFARFQPQGDGGLPAVSDLLRRVVTRERALVAWAAAVRDCQPDISPMASHLGTRGAR